MTGLDLSTAERAKLLVTMLDALGVPLIEAKRDLREHSLSARIELLTLNDEA